MNASTHFFSSGLDRYDHHPVLIAASSESAARRAAETVQQADLPLWAMPIEQALARFGKQSSATAFWLEVEADGPDLDPLLDRLDAEVGAGAFPAIIPKQSDIDPKWMKLDRGPWPKGIGLLSS